MNDKIKVGDWVRSYSSGIWQVYRIEDYLYEPIFSSETKLIKYDYKIVHVKRLVNNSWKRSFNTESCTHLHITKISEKELREVEKFINDKPKIYLEFEKYSSPIDTCLNLGFYVSDDEDVDEFNTVVDNVFKGKIASGLTNPEIIELIEKGGLNKYKHRTIRNATIQFVSLDSESENGHVIYREYSVLDF